MSEFKLEQQEANAEQEYFDGNFALLHENLSQFVSHLTQDQLDKLEMLIFVENQERQRKLEDYAKTLPF